MKRFRYVLLLGGALVAGVAPAAPPSGPAPIPGKLLALPAVFRDDTRLQAKVTLAVKNRPLREVLSKLGQELQVPLSASPDTADDKVTLLVDGRPAVEVLALLGRHFNFRWFRQFRGYELRQDAAESAREAALREGDLKTDWAELRAWVERLAGLVGTPREDLQARAREIGSRLADAGLAPNERARLTTEAAAIQDALRPATAPAVALLRGLTAVQVAQLRQDESLLLSREDGSLPPGVPRLVRKRDAEPDAPAESPRTRPIRADAQVRLIKEWYRRGPPRPVDRRTLLGVRLFVRLEGEGKLQWDSFYWSPLLPARERPIAADTDAEDPALIRTVELGTLQAPRRSVPAATRGESALTQLAGEWPAWPALGDVAEAIHEATGLEVLTDSFVRCRVDPKWVSGRQPLARILDALARELEYTWRLEGKTVLLRSRSYHWDRAAEVPQRVLRPWQERAGRPGTRPLDAFAELAAMLSDLQTLGISQYWGWYLEDPWIAPPAGAAIAFYQQRRHLRFWAVLNPVQRQAALSGTIVPAERMSPSQRTAFVTALTDPHVEPWEPVVALLLPRRGITPAEVLSAGFSVKSAEWRTQLFQGTKPGGEPTRIRALHPASRPANLGNLPPEFQWSVMGDPARIDIHTFAYHLDGEQAPVRSVDVSVLQPRAAP